MAKKSCADRETSSAKSANASELEDVSEENTAALFPSMSAPAARDDTFNSCQETMALFAKRPTGLAEMSVPRPLPVVDIEVGESPQN